MGAILSNLANQAISTGLGLMLEKHEDKRQLSQQQKLQDLQVGGAMQLTNYNTQKQLELWKATNYPAQMEQLKTAGLNPALMYGMGGGGATTANIDQGNVSGAEAPKGGGEIAAMMGLGLQRAQLSLLDAQRKNIEADTANKQANTTKTAGVDTAATEQGIEESKAKQELTEVQTEINYIQQHIATMTQNTAVALIQRQLQQATETLNQAVRENKIGDATKQSQIETIKAQLAGIYIDNAVKKAQLGKTEAETKSITTAIKQKWNELQNQADYNAIQKQLADFQTSFGGQASHILQSLLNLIPK